MIGKQIVCDTRTGETTIETKDFPEYPFVAREGVDLRQLKADVDALKAKP